MKNLIENSAFVKLNYTRNIIPFYEKNVELDYIVNNFGEWLKANRIAKELNQQQLADRVGVTKSYISKLEKNQVTQPRTYQIEKICKALNLSFEEAKKLLFLNQKQSDDELVADGLFDGYYELPEERRALARKQIAAIIRSLKDEDFE